MFNLYKSLNHLQAFHPCYIMIQIFEKQEFKTQGPLRLSKRDNVIKVLKKEKKKKWTEADIIK